ncbi:hypothetical protein PQG02_12865 [Nostoc sp. UHCC 0926]|uniref:hypothetical protein n=1 Tax=unclassified Nostoc TaxID=2593658 RepID=UPI00236201A5|nr:hypothetical protein [Nostoc sp. UHCC 0926]WDD35149.1 hypothetical protein PQG02_12865 [Nostoc sp. UHCC 0926]
MASQIDIHLPNGVLQGLQNVRDFVGENVNSLNNSAQQVGESLKATATTTTDRAINTVTTSLEQSWQTADKFKSTTSGAVKDALASSASDWLTQHPIFFRLVQILGWATNHPIISIVILLFALALVWSIIKAIVRLIETASWSILKVPIKLIQAFIKVSFLSLVKVGSFGVQRITATKTTDNLTDNSGDVEKLTLNLTPQPPSLQGKGENSKSLLLQERGFPELVKSQNKQQRLGEISNRLEAIQKEQNELLQEAADLIASDTIEIEISEIKPLKSVESHLG